MSLDRRTFLAFGAAAAAGLALPARAREVTVLGGDAFGSYWRLTVPGAADAAADTRIGAIVAEIDMLFSPYRADSALSRFNARASTDWQPVPAALSDLAALALDLAARSAGGFDPTVGPLVARYGFGPIADAAPGHFTGLDCRDGGLRKSDADLSIDLCGIAKGHALDLMVAELDTLSIEDFVLELGGEVFARGRHPEGRRWQVAVDSPLPGARPAHLIALDGQAVATSGNTVQGYEIGGRRYGHIIDPGTGEPATGALASVSVLGPDAATADGWATALFALGEARGPAVAEQAGLDALFLVHDGDAVAPVVTGRFADRLVT